MKNNIIFFLLTIIMVTVIIFSWFSGGKIISNTNEEDLNIFHAQRTAERYSTFWNQLGTGFRVAFNMPSYPTFVFLGFLESKNIPVFLTQAIFLGALMIVGVLSMYMLISYGLKMNYQVSLVGSFFYLLNIFSMTQIWNRFIYNHIIVWAYLPVFILLWIKWISTGKFKWLLCFLLSSLIFSYAFSNPVFLSTFWIPAFIFILYKLWPERKNKKNIIYILVCSAVGLILWSAVNIWWLYPSLTLGSSWAAQNGETWQGDFDSLMGVSKYFHIWDVLLLRQSWYFGTHMVWHDFYHNPLVILINISVFLLMLYGMMKSRGFQYRSFFLILAFVGLFVSKGSNFPFGHTFFYLLFSNFPFTAALRNSYEKFGLVFLLPYSIFFAIGIYYFILRFKAKARYLYGTLIIFLSLGLLVYPMWNGDIFPPKYRLNVPAYYAEANEYLKSVSSNRIFNIPFTMEIEYIRYKWGYVGVDPSENLLEFQIVSKMKVPIMKNYYELIPKFKDNKNLPRILGLLGVDHIILSKDLVYPDPTLNHLQTIETLATASGVMKKREIGELTIYKLDKDLVKPIIYTTQLVKVNSLEDGFNKVLNDEIDTKISGFGYEDFSNTVSDNIIPKISYIKFANDHYKVSVQDAVKSFYLIFNNTYDNLWQAKIGKDIIQKHFIVNGFANGWLIDKRGSYDIDISFKVWPWQ